MEKLLSFTNRIHSLGVIFKLRISWFLLIRQVPNSQEGAEKKRRQTLQRIKCSKQLKHKEHKIKNIREIMDFCLKLCLIHLVPCWERSPFSGMAFIALQNLGIRLK